MLKRFLLAIILAFWSNLSVANALFEKPVQTTPLATMQSLKDVAGKCARDDLQSCRFLPQFCHPDGDKSTWRICLSGGAQDDETKKMFRDYFRYWSIGSAVENGDDAIVHYMFKIEDEWRNEYMNMIRIKGKWFLDSQ